MRATWWQGPAPVVQLSLRRVDHADRFAVLSQQVGALHREIAIRRTAEAQREELLLAEQAARARLQRLYQLTAVLASSATLAQVAEAVAATAARVLDVDDVSLELHSQRLVPTLEPGEDLHDLEETAWHDLDHPHKTAPTTPVGAVRITLEADDVVPGTLTVHPGTGGVADVEHLTAVGQQIAQAVRPAGLYEREHRVAERLQLSLLPQLPDVAGLEVATCYAPGSDMAMVGGDWYDVYNLDEDHIGLSIGDVACHGLPQAAVMAQIIAALRGIVLRCGTRPEAVLTELNEYLHLYHRGQMATAAYLLYHRPTRTLTYVKAGHPPPLVVRPDGSSRYLEGPICPPVGPVPGARYHQGQTTLAEGEAVSRSTPTASSNAAGKPWTPAWTGSPRRPFERRHERARSVRAVPQPPARRRLPRRPRPAPRPARLAQPTSPLERTTRGRWPAAASGRTCGTWKPASAPSSTGCPSRSGRKGRTDSPGKRLRRP
ncbi:PP2C family protein-serine/threonine phosphatase [Streptomyces achromogenes]|uniref:PP2C family protein-serine/threonine phosphatase n=1 Tax=Streptomyces achromogenes TaxID=67255 RepID=UPI00358F5DC3